MTARAVVIVRCPC